DFLLCDFDGPADRPFVRRAVTQCGFDQWLSAKQDAAALGPEQAFSATDAEEVRLQAGQHFQAVKRRAHRSCIEQQRNAAVLRDSERILQLDGSFVAILNL